MNYIVLDMEWNQPFNMKSMIKKPLMLHGEIVQIGAVKLDENYHILDTFKIMVSPKYYTKMHKKVSKLTKITTEELQYGFPFPVAFKHFKKWCGEEFAFLTWGPDDIDMLRDNMVLHDLNTEWIPSTYNIQVIFDDQIAKEKRQVSLSYAMERIGEPALEAHDALNDARNTVCICLHLDMVKGLAEYAALQKQMKCYGSHVKERSQSTRTYSTREAALNDPELINFFCPTCGSNVECVDFVRQNSDKFICIGKCENGDELFVRFKFTKWPDGKFSVARILYEMDEDNKGYYLSKKQQAEEAEAAYLQSLAIAG
jgi:inhibitor of KinA sporulation pathway (predicted exonuclease)